ncbi:TVP38/TMEM64 family protein [Capilliphycus salinus ALCB114379]|uniref:TVP38/TMEM64 family protein n=1 Tax=Capilliphycus salinus TaxID=2768948 RepID=UPI0039A66803
MLNTKNKRVKLIIFCGIITIIAFYVLSHLDSERLQTQLQQMGIFAPILYILVYTVATILILPSTALNLLGGAFFGVWWGTLWTSIAAITAAIITFTFTRTVGRKWVKKKLAGRWKVIDAEIRQGGLFYLFAIRLLPIIPYGLVNFTSGLTSISFKDYLIGTTLGTVPGLLPFVMLGSSGLKAVKTGDILPLIMALSLIGILIFGANYYRRHRTQ